MTKFKFIDGEKNVEVGQSVFSDSNEWEIIKIGRKYIHVRTSHSIELYEIETGVMKCDFMTTMLYSSIEAHNEHKRKRDILSNIEKFFREYGISRDERMSLDDIEIINNIVCKYKGNKK